MPPRTADMGNTQPRASHQHHSHHHQRRREESCGVDASAVTEAHGLVSDMLADPQVPPHVISGLRTLSALLSPPPATSCCAPRHAPRARHQGSPQRRKSSLILPYFRSSSDNEEIPFTGERPSALPKRLRKNLPPSLLRRMSTSTWTTTTSATGMPTLEPEPLRKRSTSFRNLQHPPASPPPQLPQAVAAAAAQLQQQDELRPDGDDAAQAMHLSPGLESLIAAIPDRQRPPKGQRSLSTTALPSGAPRRRDSRERKTVASLHPLTPHDVRCLESLHEDATRGGGDARRDEDEDDAATTTQQQQDAIREEEEEDEEEEEEEEEEDEELPPLPSFRRSTVMTSDYESSNDSPPSGSEEAGGRVLRAPRHAAVQTGGWGGRSPCALCGRPPSLAPSPLAAPIARREEVEEETEEGEEVEGGGAEEEGVVRLSDASFDVRVLAEDPLLGLIDIWDFPVFDMERQAGTSILSQMCYRVFLATGLFESFRIPMGAFFAYFHALEKGYRDKPYHNRMHASDVLHGVYFLISQPIPGFVQVASDSTDSPLHRTLSSRETQDRWPCPRAASSMDRVRAYIDDDGEAAAAAADSDDDDDEAAAERGEADRDSYGVMGANFPALEIMALYAAAAMHDYDHPGRTNAFLVATFSPQAVLYNDRSVLENHHAAAAWSLFLSDERFNWLRHLDAAEFKRFRFLVIECILATDLKRHFDILAEFNAKVNEDESPGLDWSCEPDRLLVMQMAIKLADINGPCKCRQIHVQWTHRIAEEFYEQGDEERERGLPISPFMDRDRPQLAKLQESFINHLVAPLVRTYADSALLPGVWIRLPADDRGAEELTESDLALTKRVGQVISGVRRKRSSAARKVVLCQQTKNLQDNYAHWVGVLRKEEQQKQEDKKGSC